MVSEERFNRKKGWGGVPRESVKWLLESTRTRGQDVDFVAVSSLVQPVFDLASADHSPLRKTVRLAARMLPGDLLASDLVVDNYVKRMSARRDLSGIRKVLDEFDIDSAKVRVVEHHTTHASTAYYLSPYFKTGDKMLVFTVDGSGDGLSATVSIGHQHRLERVHSISSYHSIGDFYMRLTQYMGMKPLEHEYKVMGLAPYAPAEWAQKTYDIVGKFFGLSSDGLSFLNKTGRWGLDLLDLMEKSLRGKRFDTVAAAGQRLVEETVVPFVRNWVKKTGIRTIGCAGGVFMNVKMNMLISQLEEIDDMFLMPSGGDESTALGAALHVQVDEQLRRGAPPEVEPLGTLYLGPAPTTTEVATALDRHAADLDWSVVGEMPDVAARLLEQNKIIARMDGPAEWGARSLGNRTIIANPSDPRNVRDINRAIKMRDFWMPFCPTVLEERQSDYTVNPRKRSAKYMINAFPSTPLAFRELICGLHPFDLTCRPQFINETDNPKWYAIVKAFERRTGIGGVMNTSFNLHGEPIVGTPADSISTLLRSEIDFLILCDTLVWKKTTPKPEFLA